MMTKKQFADKLLEYEKLIDKATEDKNYDEIININTVVSSLLYGFLKERGLEDKYCLIQDYSNFIFEMTDSEYRELNPAAETLRTCNFAFNLMNVEDK